MVAKSKGLGGQETMSLQVGQIVEYDGKYWRVGLVNPSRARLDPVTGTIHQLLTASFRTYGASVNVSPTSPLSIVEDKHLTPEQHRRAENLAHRTEDSLIIQQPTSYNSESEGQEQEMALPTAAAGAGPAAQPGTAKAKPAKAAAPATAAVAQPTVSAQKLANKQRLDALKAKQQEKAAAKAEKKAKEPKVKEVHPCLCGCGAETTASFAQGHDARYKGWMIKVERGEMAVKDLPPVVQKANQFIKKGDGYVTVKNYKGEPHKGYDKAAA